MTQQRIEEIVTNLVLTEIARGKSKEEAVKEAEDVVKLITKASQEIAVELRK